MIIAVIGNLRSGKTFIMTMLAYISILFAYKQLSPKDMERLLNANEEISYNENIPTEKTVIVKANYKIDVPNFEFFGIKELLELVTLIEKGEPYDLHNCILCLDEIVTILESRVSGSVLSRLMSYFIMQSGKADVQLIYTSQLDSMADIRLRSLANITIRCRKNKVKQKFNYIWTTDTGHIKKFNLPLHKAKQFYYLYDTKQKIPLASIQIRNALNKAKQEQKEQELKEKRLERKLEKML